MRSAKRGMERGLAGLLVLAALSIPVVAGAEAPF